MSGINFVVCEHDGPYARLQALCTAAQTVRVGPNAVAGDYGERHDTAWEHAVLRRARWLLDQAAKGDW